MTQAYKASKTTEKAMDPQKTPELSELQIQTQEERDTSVLAKLGKKSVLTVRSKANEKEHLS